VDSSADLNRNKQCRSPPSVDHAIPTNGIYIEHRHSLGGLRSSKFEVRRAKGNVVLLLGLLVVTSGLLALI
jgi:hypothetical protein